MSAAGRQLASWREGNAKRAILALVDRVTEPGSAGFVPPSARVAVFDNDGTLWCERPTYPQALFLMDRVRARAAADPVFAARPIVRAVAPDEYASEVAAWFEQAVHPTRGVAFGRLVYRPMVELLDLLRALSFRVFIVTGGGVEFVRAVSEDLYGIPPDDVVGSSVELAVERRDGRLVLVRQPAFRGPPNEGEPKPVNIQAHIGVRPILAAGNSAGDREMLEYTSTGPGPSLALVIDHDDPEREDAYGGASFTDPGAEPVLATAGRLGWTVVSMRRDWATVFGE